MKSMRINLLFALAVILAFGGWGCKKYVPGPKGDAGSPGKNGNMKQYDISSFQQAASAWTLNTLGVWESTVSTPQITPAALSDCEVDVYMLVENVWRSLPYAEGDIVMQFTIEAGRLRLKYSKIHNGPPANPGAASFRVAIMTPV